MNQVKKSQQSQQQPKPFLKVNDNKSESPFSLDNFWGLNPFNKEGAEEALLNKQRLRYENIIREEKVLFSRRQKELAKKIEELRKELLKLAKEIVQDSHHIQKVLLEDIPEPSVYHLGFLEKIKKTLIFLRKRVHQSKTWLEEWQERAMKKRYYWYYFKKSGAKFWLSGERAIATQTG